MEFRFRQIESLPRLAWCATFRRGATDVDLAHGPWVETRDTFFCEGTWNGDFAQGNFQTGFMMGSGGKLEDGGVLFVSPCHPVERLHYIRSGDSLFVSNSLVFVLSQANEELDPHYPNYSGRLHSIVKGVQEYAKRIPTKSGNDVNIRYYCNLLVDSETNVTELPKSQGRDFADYSDYRSFLQ
ncbi:MAG: hypothetical protein ACE5Q6_17860, partial [Dehalococcoidia bacterium]